MSPRGSNRVTKRGMPKRFVPWPPEQAEEKAADVEDQRVFAQSVVSPLRYPGAKRQLVPIIEQIVRANIQPPRLLLEPFCGGASATLRLVGTEAVQHAILADADELIYSFWYVAAFHTSWLINRMLEIPVTVERWEWWRKANPKGVKDKALKCLFLNRTTFSGILHGWAGPIGGKKQISPYKIDCRFNKEALAKRIKAIGELADTGRLLDVWNCDWADSLDRMRREYCGRLSKDEILVYLDPPYVEKAPYLYEWSFEDDHHNELATALTGDLPFRWLLSYDLTARTRALYPPKDDRAVILVKSQYSAAGIPGTVDKKRNRTIRDELLVTNLETIPTSDRYRVE